MLSEEIPLCAIDKKDASIARENLTAVDTDTETITPIVFLCGIDKSGDCTGVSVTFEDEITCDAISDGEHPRLTGRHRTIEEAIGDIELFSVEWRQSILE
jgi:ribosomal protein L31